MVELRTWAKVKQVEELISFMELRILMDLILGTLPDAWQENQLLCNFSLIEI